MIAVVSIAALVLALIPCVLFLRNLRLYLPLPKAGNSTPKISVLIPARNEEANIEQALHSVLQSEGVELEIVVLDDGSTDRTAELVGGLAATDGRIRLETAASLPPGWCGKNFACHQLAARAQHPLLVFMDADVRVSRSDSLARLARFVEESGADFVSGVPFEETRGFMERLIIPLIHFVLLGFLPLNRMRKSSDSRFAAACGQILAVQSSSYMRVGGHAAIADRIHDAVALAHRFREHGIKTDLFDATDTFHCRMYRTGSEVWNGFAKNAHEGLATPALIVPATLLLLGGQVLPLVCLAFASTPLALGASIVAVVAMFLPRLLGIARFRQSILGAVLHPLGITILVLIQWSAFLRSLRRRPAVWKGRAYSAAPAS